MIFVDHLQNSINKFINKENAALPLEVIRAGIGLVILTSYLSMYPYMMDLFWINGWVDYDVFLLDSIDEGRFSVLQYIHEPWQLKSIYILMLFLSVAFLFGFATKYVKWPLLVLFISFQSRNLAMTYGVDEVCASILFLLCIAPVGRLLSLDRLIILRYIKLKRSCIDIKNSSLSGAIALRLIQLQMALLFFYTGIEKIRGELWWQGDALWIAMNNFEFNNIPTGFFAEHYWLIQIITHGVVFFEIAYLFLIWGKHRAVILAIAISLHIGIAVIMGLYLFAFTMILGHLAFFKHRWYLMMTVFLRQRLQHVSQRTG